MQKRIGLLSLAFFLSFSVQAGVVETNSVRMTNAPDWLSESRVRRVTDKIERVLEWPIRRVTALWHLDPVEFEKLHGYGPTVLAFAKATDNSVHLGPRVTTENFDTTFGHELVHVIVYQKYKTAIPKWLEEGLASYIAGERRVNYKWLASRPEVQVTAMTHPFKGLVESQQHYEMSTAVMEMIAAKCPLADLLQLSVGKSLVTYLDTFCGIPDVNLAFKAYLQHKSN